MAPQKQSFPPGYGEDKLSEEQISNFLKAQKMASQVNVFELEHLKCAVQVL